MLSHMVRRTVLMLAALAVAVFAVALVEGPRTASADGGCCYPPPITQNPNVSMLDNYFRPAVIHVSVGTTVTWRNEGQRPHTTTSVTRAWDSYTLQPGQSFSARFFRPGVYRYLCTIHPREMRGVVVVHPAGATGAGGTARMTGDAQYGRPQGSFSLTPPAAGIGTSPSRGSSSGAGTTSGGVTLTSRPVY